MVSNGYTVKYPTSDLIFQYTHDPLYKEKSSHEWDISWNATRKHCITILSHTFYICITVESELWTAYKKNTTSSDYIVKRVKPYIVDYVHISKYIYSSALRCFNFRRTQGFC